MSRGSSAPAAARRHPPKSLWHHPTSGWDAGRRHTRVGALSPAPASRTSVCPPGLLRPSWPATHRSCPSYLVHVHHDRARPSRVRLSATVGALPAAPASRTPVTVGALPAAPLLARHVHHVRAHPRRRGIKQLPRRFDKRTVFSSTQPTFIVYGYRKVSRPRDLSLDADTLLLGSDLALHTAQPRSPAPPPRRRARQAASTAPSRRV